MLKSDREYGIVQWALSLHRFHIPRYRGPTVIKKFIGTGKKSKRLNDWQSRNGYFLLQLWEISMHLILGILGLWSLYSLEGRPGQASVIMVPDIN